VSKTRLRIGIIGCGNIGLRHAQAWLTISREAEVVAACDVRQESASAVAELVGGAAVFGDVSEMLANVDLDAVDICLPHNLHRNAILAAASHGKHVLCEKPVCLTRTEADEITRAIAESGVTFMPAHNAVFGPATKRTRELLLEGLLGPVYEIRASYASRWKPSKTEPDLGWRTNAAIMGGGNLIDGGVHSTYQLMYFAGRIPAKVQAVMSRHRLKEMEGEDSAQLLLQFDDGTIGHVISTYAYDFPEPWSTRGEYPFQVIGERGQLYGVRNLLFYRPVGFGASSITLPMVDDFEAELAEFAECIRMKREPIQTLADGIAAVKVIQGAYRSAREERVIDLSQTDSW